MTDHTEQEAVPPEAGPKGFQKAVGFVKNNKIYSLGAVALAAYSLVAPAGVIALSAYAGIKLLPGPTRTWLRSGMKDYQSFAAAFLVTVMPAASIASTYVYDDNKNSAYSQAKGDVRNELLAGTSTSHKDVAYFHHSPWSWQTTPALASMDGTKSKPVTDGYYRYFSLNFGDNETERYQQPLSPSKDYANSYVSEGHLSNVHDGYFTVTNALGETSYYREPAPQPPKGYEGNLRKLNPDGTVAPN